MFFTVGVAPAHASGPVFTGSLYTTSFDRFGNTFTVRVTETQVVSNTEKNGFLTVCSLAVSGPNGSHCLDVEASFPTTDASVSIKAYQGGSIRGDTVTAGETRTLLAGPAAAGTGASTVRESVALKGSPISFERGFTATGHAYYRFTMPSYANNDKDAPQIRTVVQGSVSDAEWNDALYIADAIRNAKADENVGTSNLNWGAGFIGLNSAIAIYGGASLYAAGAVTVAAAASVVLPLVAAIGVAFFFFNNYSSAQSNYQNHVDQAIARFEERFGNIAEGPF